MARLAGIDALLIPTAPEHPTIAEVAADPIGVNSRMGTYTNFCNLFDLCAVAVPAGTAGPAHFGVTVLARAFEDAVAADIAGMVTGSVVEGWSAAAAPSVELAVFGAHLLGQPLEHQLTTLGARWLGPVWTAPNYRLTALDTVPRKPGLIRVADGGVSIAGEKLATLPGRTRGLPRRAADTDAARRRRVRRRELGDRIRVRSRRGGPRPGHQRVRRLEGGACGGGARVRGRCSRALDGWPRACNG